MYGVVEVNGACFYCDECPICEGIEHRLRWAKEDGCEPQVESCYCDKVGTTFWFSGYCEDAWSDASPKHKQGRRRSGAAYRREKDILKKERLMRISGMKWTRHHAAYELVDGDWVTKPYLRHPHHSKSRRFDKNYSNRIIRRGGNTGSGKGGYKKAFEYWWTLE